MAPEMMDKCVSTNNDFIIQVGDSDASELEFAPSPQWKISQLQNLLAQLIRSKLISDEGKVSRGESAVAFHHSLTDKSSSSSSSIELIKTRKKPAKDKQSGGATGGGHRHSHHRHHHHHHHKNQHHRYHHHQNEERGVDKSRTRTQDQGRIGACASEVKVRRWSEESFPVPLPSGVFAPPGLTSDGGAEINLTSAELANMDHKPSRLPNVMTTPSKRRSMENNNERKLRRPEKDQKRRRKRRKKESRKKRTDPLDVEDLPKRAKWTIIITAGLLLMTCMLLVGITLRMAPIIDQIVMSQNEELMNSISRQEVLPHNKTGS